MRLTKTRKLATEACNKGKVKLNGQPVKPGKEVSAGDQLLWRKNPVWLVYEVKEIPKSRVGAKLVPDLIADLTPEHVLKELQNITHYNQQRAVPGFKGRPSKKDRRNLDDFLSFPE